jgi:hypothetical protein
MGPGKIARYASATAVMEVLASSFFFVLRERRRPTPLSPRLFFLLENPLTGAFVGAPLLVGRLGLTPGMKVLDAGCGPGRLTVPLAKAVGPGGGVVALDGQADMLGKLEGRLRAEVGGARPRLTTLARGVLWRTPYRRSSLRSGGAGLQGIVIPSRGIIRFLCYVGLQRPSVHKKDVLYRSGAKAGPRCSQATRSSPAGEKTRERPEGSGSLPLLERHLNASGGDGSSAGQHIFGGPEAWDDGTGATPISENAPSTHSGK